ncbi:MAG: hypothetical protein K6V36_13560 [Anaerolineae bacterium]|nr:hypothetical protein [Anaerolineae bacterium]
MPAVRTVALSLQTGGLGRAGRFVGLANYAELLHRTGLGAAIVCTLLVALVRLVAVLGPPALVGCLALRSGARARTLAGMVLGAGLALSAPAGLGLLWRVALPRVPALRWLAAEASPGALPSHLALECVAFLGVGGCLTATALLLVRRPSCRVVCGLLALAGIAAVASGLNAFSLSFVATSGISTAGAATFALRILQLAFREVRPGQGAAGASLLLLPGVALGVAFGLVSERLGLRLVSSRQEVQGSRLASIGTVLAAALLVLPLVGLYLWGAGEAFLYQEGAIGRAASALAAGPAFLNGVAASVLPVALVQLPAAYLAALSLTLVRPFGRAGSRIAYLCLLGSGFVPPVAIGIGLFDVAREARLLNTLPGAGLPLLAGAAGLYVFRLHFAGREEAWEAARAAGRQGADLLRMAIRGSGPAVALAGMVALIVAGQSLVWPLVALERSELLPLSLQLVARRSQLAGAPLAAAGAWLVLTLYGLPILLLWWLLQGPVLQQIELVGS